MDTLPHYAQEGKVFIYSLVDPETKQVRYIGKTNNPSRRIYDHLHAQGKTHRHRWIASLMSKKLPPEIQIIEEVAISSWQEREQYWIAFYRGQGADLVNGTDGGEGIISPTPEIRAQRSANTSIVMSDATEREKRMVRLNSSESKAKRAKTRRRKGINNFKSLHDKYAEQREQAESTLMGDDTILSEHKGGGPLSPEQRERKQARFLKAYRESGNIKASCKAAGINRSTFYDWRDHDEVFQAQLPDAMEDARDTLEYAAYERAVKGIESPVVSMGRIVYEEVPVLDEHGKPQQDEHGKPLMQHGKPLMERKYSDALLTTLLKANLPKKYKDKVEHTGKDDGPIKFVTEWGGGFLEEEDEE
jgi:hypothetical protein